MPTWWTPLTVSEQSSTAFWGRGEPRDPGFDISALRALRAIAVQSVNGSALVPPEKEALCVARFLLPADTLRFFLIGIFYGSLSRCGLSTCATSPFQFWSTFFICTMFWGELAANARCELRGLVFGVPCC